MWGHTGGDPGFATFAGGKLGGKHTLAISLNNFKANSPDSVNNFLLAEFSQ